VAIEAEFSARLASILLKYETSVKHVITLGRITEQIYETFSVLRKSVIDYTELSYMRAAKDNPPLPETIAAITYTSGSEGEPKMVVLTHRHLIASAAGTKALGITHRPSDVLVSYLPYSHLFERSMLTIVKLTGCRVGFITSE
jgi:long-subunit acyl-CoA synthetase (AMP-forming)